jgi:hypothetical protein
VQRAARAARRSLAIGFGSEAEAEARFSALIGFGFGCGVVALAQRATQPQGVQWWQFRKWEWGGTQHTARSGTVHCDTRHTAGPAPAPREARD